MVSRSELQEEATRYYSDLHTQHDYLTTFPEFVCKRLVTYRGNTMLMAPIAMEEIEVIIKMLIQNKALGLKRLW